MSSNTPISNPTNDDKVPESSNIIKDHSHNLFDNASDSIDNAKITIDTKSRNRYNPSKSSNLKEEHQEDFDLQTYKKFLSFLKFQEMMDKYDT